MTRYGLNSAKIVRHHIFLIILGLFWLAFGTIPQTSAGMLRAIGSATLSATTEEETCDSHGSASRSDRFRYVDTGFSRQIYYILGSLSIGCLTTLHGRDGRFDSDLFSTDVLVVESSDAIQPNSLPIKEAD